MKVRELIDKLEKIENKELEVYILAKVWDSHFEEELGEYNSIKSIYVENESECGCVTLEGDR